MAAWTEPQKTAIRHYMGVGVPAKMFYPALEGAMITVLAVADGGSQVDNSTQLAIVAQLARLADVDTRLDSLSKRVMVDTAEAGSSKARIDPARGMAALRMHGRMVASGLARYLGFTAVLSDIYTATTPHVPPFIGQDIFSS